MKKIALILLIVISFAFVACATPYTRYIPQAVTDNPIGTKIGTAPCSATGIQDAAKSAGITKIATVDIRIVFDGKVTTREFVVSGE